MSLNFISIKLNFEPIDKWHKNFHLFLILLLTIYCSISIIFIVIYLGKHIWLFRV
jgi:hypothetical protein